MSRRLRFAALLSLVASGVAPASAEMLVVVHSNSKSWPAGTPKLTAGGVRSTVNVLGELRPRLPWLSGCSACAV